MSPAVESVTEKGRLLIVTTVASTAGAFLLPYADHMRRAGWKVALATSALPAQSRLSAHFDEIFNMPWERTISAVTANLAGLRHMRRLLQSCRFDLVHTHTPVASFLVRLACVGLRRNSRPTVIYTAHGFHFHRNGKSGRNAAFLLLEKVAGFWTDYLILINEEDAEAARKLRLVAPGCAFKTPGIGIPLSDYSRTGRLRAESRNYRNIIRVPHDVPLIVMVAEFNPGKRHEDLVRAVALSHRFNWHIAFAGNGRTQDEIRRLAAELGLSARCHFLGFCSDVPALLACADISVLPSEREGMPRAVMESMAMGVPVLGANARGIRDLLQGGCGLLHEVQDIKAIQAGLEQLMDSAPLRAMLVANALKRISDYDLPPLLSFHQWLYQRILTERRDGTCWADANTTQAMPP